MSDKTPRTDFHVVVSLSDCCATLRNQTKQDVTQQKCVIVRRFLIFEVLSCALNTRKEHGGEQICELIMRTVL